jgi:hypothetical protein
MLAPLGSRFEDLVARCGRAVRGADRGWKATALGVAIVLLTTFVL